MLQSPITRHIGDLAIGLESYFWEALEDVARRERISVEALCALVQERLVERQRRRGDVVDLPAATASALRVLPGAYYRHAAALGSRPIGPLAAAYRTISAPPSEVLHSGPAVASGKSAYTRMQPRRPTS